MTASRSTFRRWLLLLVPPLTLILLAVVWLSWQQRCCPPLLVSCRSGVTAAELGQAVDVELRLRLPPAARPQGLDWRLGDKAVGHPSFSARRCGIEPRGVLWAVKARLSGVAPGRLEAATLRLRLEDGRDLAAALPPVDFHLEAADLAWMPPPAPPLDASLLQPAPQAFSWGRAGLAAAAVLGLVAALILVVLCWRRRRLSAAAMYGAECRAAAALPPERRDAERLLAFRRWCWRRHGLPLGLSGSELAVRLTSHSGLPPDLAAAAAAALAGHEESRFLPRAGGIPGEAFDALVAAERRR